MHFFTNSACVFHPVTYRSGLDTVLDHLISILQGTKRITGQYSLLRTSAPQEVLVRTGQHWSVPVSTGPYILGRPVKFSNSQDADNLHTIRKRMPIPPMTPGSLTP